MRTYKVLRCTNPPNGKREQKIEAEGLSWSDVTALCEKMQAAEDALHPRRSSWTKDLFIRELEQDTLFEMGNPPAPPWTRHGPKGLSCGAVWKHESGWRVTHCGHPTANWPYTLEDPQHQSTIVSFNGLGFRSAAVGRAVVERILAGTAKVTEGCVSLTATGEEVA